MRTICQKLTSLLGWKADAIDLDLILVLVRHVPRDTGARGAGEHSKRFSRTVRVLRAIELVP